MRGIMNAPSIESTPGQSPSRGSASALVETSDVHRVYRQGTVDVRALRGVDFQLESGEFTALAGPSGSGKTTLLNMIGALDRPTSGVVTIDGHVVSSYTRAKAAEYRLANLGFVFQAYNLIPVLTAYENAEFVLALQGMAKPERRARVVPLLERVGLGDHLERKPHELSGGQQQRVAVVRAIAPSPRLVLADEPTANLDTETSESLLDLLLELGQKDGVTFLFSTHDPAVIGRARRVVRMDSGRITADEVK